LTVHVAVAPPFLVTLQAVGLTRVVNPWCRRPDATVLQPRIGDWIHPELTQRFARSEPEVGLPERNVQLLE
jgi:hypothetical protein